MHKTADGGSYMDSFPTGFIKLRMLAVIWTVFLHHKKCPYNCGPWQLYGHDSITADAGSYMDSFLTLKTGGDKTFCLAYPHVSL